MPIQAFPHSIYLLLLTFFLMYRGFGTMKMYLMNIDEFIVDNAYDADL
jgi:hypothetical protein